MKYYLTHYWNAYLFCSLNITESLPAVLCNARENFVICSPVKMHMSSGFFQLDKKYPYPWVIYRFSQRFNTASNFDSTDFHTHCKKLVKRRFTCVTSYCPEHKFFRKNVAFVRFPGQYGVCCQETHKLITRIMIWSRYTPSLPSPNYCCVCHELTWWTSVSNIFDPR